MLKIELRNDYLQKINELLYDVPLKGKESRHRTKFIHLINEGIKELQESLKELQKEHAYLDDDGKPKLKEDNDTIQIKDMQAFQEDLKVLYQETIIIEGGDNQRTLETVKEVIEDFNKELSGQEAFIYAYLYDQFEKGEDE